MTERVIHAVAALLAITNPIGAAGFFLAITEGSSRKDRVWGAFHTTFAVALILAGSAMFGLPMLKFFGIDLPAFKVAGGLLIVVMGLEMARGSPSKVQGGAHHVNAIRDNMVVPLAMPIIAGPGAITTAITLTTPVAGDKEYESVVITLVSVAISAGVLLGTLIAAAALGRFITQRMISIITRFMGLILVAIGFQLGMDAIKTFFG